MKQYKVLEPFGYGVRMRKKKAQVNQLLSESDLDPTLVEVLINEKKIELFNPSSKNNAE